MAERTTAEDRLHRLLYTLPAAASAGGMPLSELASRLGVSRREILRDLREATDLAFHRPAGSVDPFSILIEADDGDETVHVHTTGDFERPAKLTPREALALVLGLRSMAAEVVPDQRDPVLSLARRLQDGLASPDVQREAGEGAGGTAGPSRRGVGHGGTAAIAYGSTSLRAVHDAGGILDVEGILDEAAERHCRCRIQYLKLGESRPAWRRIEPWRFVVAEGTAYVVARLADEIDDPDSRDLRLFRLDRVLDAEILEGDTFEVPADFSVRELLGDSPYMPPEDEEQVVVEYASPAARWVAEASGQPLGSDGTVTVTHGVADVHWIVRHVFSYGGAAVVKSPEHVRRTIAERAKSAIANSAGAAGAAGDARDADLPARKD